MHIPDEDILHGVHAGIPVVAITEIGEATVVVVVIDATDLLCFAARLTIMGDQHGCTGLSTKRTSLSSASLPEPRSILLDRDLMANERHLKLLLPSTS